MFIILLFQTIYSLELDNFLCGLRLYYDQESYFLLDQKGENAMPYILTSKSPHFALDIQQNYKPANSMNNNSYFLIDFPDAYIFAGNATDLQWLQIQEFKVQQNQTKADVLIYNDYYGYYVDKGNQGGHMLISKQNLIREFSFGKTDALDKFLKPGFIYIVTWSSQGDVIILLVSVFDFVQNSVFINYQFIFQIFGFLCFIKMLLLQIHELAQNINIFQKQFLNPFISAF